MSDANELEILRRELRMEKERGMELSRRMADLERRLEMLDDSTGARLAGENDPESINYKLRRLQNEVGSPEAGGEDIEGGGITDGGSGGGGSSISTKLAEVKAALCGATGSGTCNGDGTMTVTITLPGLTCP